MRESFTLADIRAAWDKYKGAKCLRVLKDGEWQTRLMDGRPLGHIDGARAEVVDIRTVTGFPEYLEKMWTK